MKHIVTAQAEAMPLALSEAGSPRVLRGLEPGVLLCEGVQVQPQPIFLRHLCPAQREVALSGSMEDIAALSGALSGLLPLLGAAESFSVQSRIAEGYHPPYKRFELNTALSGLAGETGAALDVRNPVQVISVVLAEGAGWIGISRAHENLSAWGGGMRRYKWEEKQISRAEFKLLEALETFGIRLMEGKRALDLGAAPGGWTRVLRGRGLSVTAVDPAALDPGILRDAGVEHFRGTAQAYFQSPARFDMMVNDMKMDSDASARLMVEGAACLEDGADALLTLKLPENSGQWLPRVRRAESILSGAYRVLGVRQLFHNRSEVTVHLKKK